MTVLAPKAPAPVRALDEHDRYWMAQILYRMAQASALRDIGNARYGRRATINVAEAGTFNYIPAKGFTFTDTGSIFIREEVLVGMLSDQYTASRVLSQIEHGQVVNPAQWLTGQQNVVREVLAAYGVTGHEYGHLAGSEHAGRRAWQMVLEDLRIESMWLDADPIRARQALRACAEYWVAGDKSPTETGGLTVTIDPDQYRTKADVLHSYLLFVGRARIGVLASESLLVEGVRRVASQVFDYDELSEADEIVDRYLETARDHEDPSGIAERAALAARMARLAQDEPRHKGGCFHGPKSGAEPGSDTEPGERESGQGEGEGDSDSGEQGEPGDSGDSGKQGDQPGDTGSDSDKGEEQGKGSDGEGDSGDVGMGDDNSDGKGDSEGDGDSDSDGSEGSGNKEGAPGSDSGKGNSEGGAGFESLAEGAQVKGKVRPTDDGYKGAAAEARTEHGGHERIDAATAKALAEALSEGLTEVSDPTAEAGFAIPETDALAFAVDRIPAKRVSQEVFSPRQKVTRNRRIRNS